ncbi:MAG: hypothetical protein MI923_20205 [Phycisphaerales bacterium]|nr:hypothetical protein [Phycisphaerales bacterium]
MRRPRLKSFTNTPSGTQQCDGHTWNILAVEDVIVIEIAVTNLKRRRLV